MAGLYNLKNDVASPADLAGFDIVDCTASTLTLTAGAHAGKIVTLSRAAGVTVTLPAASGSGNVYRIMVKTAVTSNSDKIQAASASDSFLGICFGVDDDADAAYAWKAETNDDTVTMNGAATGGKAGDFWTIIDVASGLFWTRGEITQSGGSEATPYSAAVS